MTDKVAGILGPLALDTVHDLSTPLASLVLIARELESVAAGNPDLLKTTTELIHEIARMRDRLASFRADASALLGDRDAPVALADLLEDCLAACTPGDITVDHDLPSGGAPDLQNGPLVQCALQNILANAVRHARTRVDVQISWTTGEMRIHVADDGDGFDVDLMTSADTAFMTSKTAETMLYGGGMGLGMFIAQIAITQCGGMLKWGNSSGDDSPGGAFVEIRFPYLDV